VGWTCGRLARRRGGGCAGFGRKAGFLSEREKSLESVRGKAKNGRCGKRTPADSANAAGRGEERLAPRALTTAGPQTAGNLERGAGSGERRPRAEAQTPQARRRSREHYSFRGAARGLRPPSQPAPPEVGGRRRGWRQSSGGRPRTYPKSGSADAVRVERRKGQRSAWGTRVGQCGKPLGGGCSEI
jgi:hypothetical protein